MRNYKCEIINAKFKMRNSKCEIQNAKFKKCGMNNHSSYLALIFLSFIKYI